MSNEKWEMKNGEWNWEMSNANWLVWNEDLKLRYIRNNKN